MIFVADATGLCVHVGREWTALTGQPIADSLGYGWIACVHPEDSRIVREVIRTAASTASEFSVRYRLLRVDGQPCWVVAGCIPSFGPPDKTFLGYLGSLTKIAEDAAKPMLASGEVGCFVPPPSHGLTAPSDSLDRVADHLIAAHSILEAHGTTIALAALPGLRMALFEVGRALAARERAAPTLN